MKNLVTLMVAVIMILLLATANAADLGVQVIGGTGNAVEPVSLDDLKLEKTAIIPGWCELTLMSFDYVDQFATRNAGVLGKIEKYQYSDYDRRYYYDDGSDYKYRDPKYETVYNSGTQADYARLFIDILNSTASKINFIQDASVKVIFSAENGDIEYAGWVRQRDYDLNIDTWIDPSDNFVIDPYYVGHYVFGCTLPNNVISSKLPLRMEILLGDNELTYNIRK